MKSLKLVFNKVLVLWSLLLFVAVGAYSQDVTLTVQAPNAVVKGERFRVSFVVNTNKAKDFRAPVFEGLTELSGPSTSTSSSMQIINGQRTSSASITYTYVLIAEEEGEFTIKPASVVVDKKTIQSSSKTIKVLPPDNNSSSSGQQQQQSGNRNYGSAQSSNPASIGADDLFMLATVDKKKVYEQEALLLTYKVYVSTSLNLTNLTTNMPDLKNFHVQEVELPRQKEFQLEHYNGRNYKTLLWSQYVLFPQQSGKLEIPATTFEGIISIPVQATDMFDAIFNAGRYIDIKKELVSNKQIIQVEALPAGKNGNFYGGVGDFSISSDINTTELTANEAVTIKVVLSGTGNLKLVKTPEIKFPQDFDIYDPKVENKYTIKNGRQTGNKVYEYLAIPRFAGEYKIPAMEYQYFDPKSGTYKTLTTKEYVLNVAKGTGSDATQTTGVGGYVSKEELRFVGEDVRFHTTGTKLIKTNQVFFGSFAFYICLLIPLIILLAVVFVARKSIADNANMAKTKRKKANSTAVKRLKVAKKLMANNNKDQFYDEVLRALWGYFGDKLVIPVAQLSKDNVGNELKGRGVTDALIGQTIKLLDDCEFAKYAPGNDEGRMDAIYEEAVNVISQMENAIK